MNAFVSHTHMDHFFGFDWLLRVCLGGENTMRLYGPPGIVPQVEAKLRAYTWDLVARYDTNFTFDATEIDPGGTARRACFRCRSQFRRESETKRAVADGVLLDEPAFRVRCVSLDHRTPCLGFTLDEKQHVNVWKSGLAACGCAGGDPVLLLAPLQPRDAIAR